MDREAWRVTVHGVAGVRYDLATKPPPPPHTLLVGMEYSTVALKTK